MQVCLESSSETCAGYRRLRNRRRCFPHTLMSNAGKHDASTNSCFEMLFRGRVSPFSSQQRACMLPAGQLFVCFPVERADIPGSLADEVEQAE